MSFRRTLTTLALAGFLLGVSPALAQDNGLKAPGIYNPDVYTPTTLFFHINGFQDFPINTQKPDDSFKKTSGVGVLTATLTCAGQGTNQPLVEQTYNKFYGYSSPSYVEYNVTQDGQPRIHPERGFSYDVQWNKEKGIKLTWYLESQVTPGQPDPPAPNPQIVPIPTPQVVVKATMRAGDSISINDIAYDSGPILAQGQSNATNMLYVPEPLLSTLPPGTTGYVGETDPSNPSQSHHVYKFDVPMEIKANEIPKETGYNLRIDIFVTNPVCNDPTEDPTKSFMPNSFRIHTSPDWRPNMQMEVKNPLRIEYLHPQFIADQLVVHASINSPWGNYDVDESAEGIKSKIVGPNGIEARSYGRASLTQRFHEHYFHTQAVDAAYIWDYEADRAPNGVYTVQLLAKNDQGNAEAEGIAQFDIGKFIVKRCGQEETTGNAEQKTVCEDDDQSNDVTPQGNQDTPGPGLLLPFLGVLGLAFLARRRMK